MRLPVKLVFIVVLLLLLFIPFLFINFLVEDRHSLLRRATEEIKDSFSREQNILSPVILLTYRALNKRQNDPEFIYRYIIPETVKIDGKIDTDTKKRSIYSVPVYTGVFNISAKFVIPEPSDEFSVLDVNYAITGGALLGFGISDLKGLKTFPAFKINGGEPILPTGTLGAYSHYFLGIPIAYAAGDAINTEIDFELNGTESLKFTATGVESEIDLSGDWGDPSFNGYILPDERTIAPEGFTAKWRTTSLSRKNFAEQYYWVPPNTYSYQRDSEAFGLSLFNTVDNYSLVGRAVKYGFWVVLMSYFLIFMLEILLKYRFHLVQYGFTGIALLVFFLLLLSLSEYIGFTTAYIIAAAAQLSLISVYIYAVFKRKTTIVFTTFLTAFLAFIYTLLNLSEYALLIGSLFTAVVLAIGMLVTRKVDWNNI